jgi:glycosyltransferase involved in cell wall biosynthesis
MRVLEVIPSLGRGGAEAALLRRATHAPADVRTTLVVGSPPTPDQAAALASAGVDVVSPIPRGGAALRRLVAERTPDIIVTHAPAQTARILAAVRDTPIVVVAHHEVASDRRVAAPAAAAILRVLNPRAALHLAVSGDAARGPQCRGARRVVVHPLGSSIDVDAVPLDAWPHGTELRWMTLSRLVWFKNIPGLVRAVARVADDLRRSRAHLVVVGDGPERLAVEQAIASGNVADLVTLAGAVEEPSALLQRADALLTSATSEGGPLTVFEALLAGCRVLATPTGVAPVALADDPGSVLARSASDADLAAALLRLAALGPVPDADRPGRRERAAPWSADARDPLFYDHLRSALGRA